MDWNKASAELAKPLDPENIRPAQKFGPKGDYIEAWKAQAEANAIFGHGGWSMEVVRVDRAMEMARPIGRDAKPGWGVTYTAQVRITVGDVIREDFGAGHGYDVDLGLAHESAIKEAVSDAMKRAFKGFGWRFGLALYDKARNHVGEAEPEGPTPEELATAKHHISTAKTVSELVAYGKAMRKDQPLVAGNAEFLAAWKARRDELEKETSE